MTIILFLVVLSILVFVHELGHFLVAKATKMRVDEFAIGFPPRIFGKKIGETLYAINLLPLGGYVKIFGENPADVPEDDAGKDGFLNKPKIARLAVLSAGVLFNFLFAWLLFAVIFMFGFPAPRGSFGFNQKGETTVVQVAKNSPAEKQGIKEGDVISDVSVTSNNTKKESTISSDDLFSFIGEHPNETIHFDILRKGKALSFDVTPAQTTDGKKKVGLGFDDLVTVHLPFFTAIAKGYTTTIDFTEQTIVAMGGFFKNLLMFKSGTLGEVSGPVGIANVVSSAAAIGLSHLLMVMAIISINLAVLNLIPFPALDGGQIVFVIIETIIRRPVNPKIISIINLVGFSLLILLMLVVTGSDIWKMF